MKFITAIAAVFLGFTAMALPTNLKVRDLIWKTLVNLNTYLYIHLSFKML